MKLTLKHQLEFIKRVQLMTDEELVYKCIAEASGDDYDGCFTEIGRWEFYNVLLVELDKRMKNWKNGKPFSS